MNKKGAVAGFVLADKPEGMSSNLLVGRLKKALNTKKVGHTGTLDRFASGLMLLLTNRATSLSDFFLHANKSYEAVFTFGKSTDTHDPSGQIIRECSFEDSIAFLNKNEDKIKTLILNWIDQKSQIPPMYSALKTGGRRYSDLARSGISKLPASRPIQVFDINILNWDDSLAKIVIQIKVSGGTYIRSFARDLSEELQFPVFLSSLRRTALGNFEIKNNSVWKPHFDLDNKPKNGTPLNLDNIKLGKIQNLFPDWPSIKLMDPLLIADLKHGKKINLEELSKLNIHANFFICDKQEEILAWAQKTQDSYSYKRIFVDNL